MKANIVRVNTNRAQITSPQGFPVPAIITRAWNLTSISEDFFIESQSGAKIPFVIIPLSEGEITVGLADNPGEKFVISSTEVTAFLGSPMMYLIERIYAEGTTVTKFNVGI